MEKYKAVEGIDASTYAGKAVIACRTKARGIIGDEMITFKLLDFVSLMLIQNRFMSIGVFITDNNKEESYIKIIETGDESLIADLERYITLKDEIKKIEQDKQEYVEIITKLQNLTDQNDRDAVNNIVEQYLRR